MQLGAQVSGDDMDVSRKALSNLGFITYLQDAINAVENCRYPVIAAVHGKCIGGGVDLICASDIRFCAEQSIFSVREVRTHKFMFLLSRSIFCMRKNIKIESIVLM